PGVVQVDALVAMEDLVAEHSGRVVIGELDAVGMFLQLRDAEPTASQPERVAVAAQTECRIDQPPRREAYAEPAKCSCRPNTRRGRADSAADLLDDLPLLARLAAWFDDGLGPLHERLRAERRKRRREVLALEERRRGQDVVGVA